MSCDGIITKVQEGIAWLTLDRHGVGNAIDIAVARALLAAAIQCHEDPAIRCVVLTGSGKLFCAGGDLALFASAGTQVPSLLRELAETLHAALARFARMPKPLLILINGPAAGAGFSLALSGDVVLAARSAHFTAAYGAIGLTPDGGMSWLLPRLVGLRKAQEIILTNRRIDAKEAKAIGLVTDIVDDVQLMEAGRQMATRLAASSIPAFGSAKALLRESISAGFEAQLELETHEICAASITAEFKEGLSAYFERRMPIFDRLI